jgi:hypothetical protein
LRTAPPVIRHPRHQLSKTSPQAGPLLDWSSRGPTDNEPLRPEGVRPNRPIILPALQRAAGPANCGRRAGHLDGREMASVGTSTHRTMRFSVHAFPSLLPHTKLCGALQASQKHRGARGRNIAPSQGLSSSQTPAHYQSSRKFRKALFYALLSPTHLSFLLPVSWHTEKINLEVISWQAIFPLKPLPTMCA